MDEYELCLLRLFNVVFIFVEKRIESREAEAQLLKAEASAAEALEAASAAGVIMNDIPDSSSAQSHYKIELGSTTHTVSATFETAFEVDKQVSAAVKAAFIKLASCPSINKDEFRELLRKISENPDCCTDENCNDLSSDLASSECESESGSELESTSFSNEEFSDARMMMKQKKRQVSDKFNMANVVDMMLDRLRCLKEDELASLATIVATSGLNAALAETENTKLQSSSSAIDNTDNRSVKVVQSRMSLGGRNTRKPSIDTELPSLDKFLVKRLTRLEREVLEARNARKSEADEKLLSVDNTSSRIGVKNEECTAVSDLGSVLVKRSSKLEKEVEEARMNGSRLSEVDNKTSQRAAENDIPSLDKFLVKRLTRLEREVQEAKNRTKLDSIQADTTRSEGKENVDQNRDTGKKSCHADALSSNYESLDKVLVKRVSRLEKEKLEFLADEQMAIKSKRKESYKELESHGGSLDQVLVKHKSRLEGEKMGGTEQQEEDMTRHSVCRRQARERELQQAWGGLSLGNSIRPHVSRLQRDKARSSFFILFIFPVFFFFFLCY